VTEPTIPEALFEPIHNWFGLTYSNYLVLPRTALQSMPREWQRRFVDCLEELDAALGHHFDSADYTVRMMKRSNGKRLFAQDQLADYERGRRRLELRTEAADRGDVSDIAPAGNVINLMAALKSSLAQDAARTQEPTQ